MREMQPIAAVTKGLPKWLIQGAGQLQRDRAEAYAENERRKQKQAVAA